MSKIRLLRGDCLELLKDIPDGSVDAVITDPPYGTTACDWDRSVDPSGMFGKFWRVLKMSGPVIIFSQMPFTVDLVSACRKFFRYEIVWEKSRAVGFLNAKRMPLRKHENILVFYRRLPTYNPQFTEGKPYVCVRRTIGEVYGADRRQVTGTTSNAGQRCPVDVVRFANPNYKSLHPTQKPVELMEWLVRTYTNPGDTVLDCFMGSGTTGVACVRNGRDFIGMELQEKYFEVARKRITGEICKEEVDTPSWDLSTGEFHAGGIHINGSN